MSGIGEYFGRFKKDDDTELEHEPDPNNEPKKYVLWRYKLAIRYYWASSKANKKAYKQSRRLVIVLGALLTLIASLASAGFVTDRPWVDTAFSIGTPALAAILAIITGLSQSFQWGATWREQVLTAQTLRKHEDRIKLLSSGDLEAIDEIEKLNDLLLGETQQFFERVTGAVQLREEPKEPQTISSAELERDADPPA